MSLIDTWASTSAGGFSLSENALYTVEAWKTFLNRLSPTGVFSVSRWHNPTLLGESGRAMSVAVAALLRLGIADPAPHLAVLTAKHISTLLVSKEPFQPKDIESLAAFAQLHGFNATYLPGRQSDPLFAALAAARSLDGLNEVADAQSFNLRPTTDDDPYFFNMLRLSDVGRAILPGSDSNAATGVIRGNLTATFFLLALLGLLAVFTVICFAFPLGLSASSREALTQRWWTNRSVCAGVVYFSAIGCGFMFLEMGLLQRLSVFLTHPTYALGILLFGLILSTGIGSLATEALSDRFVFSRGRLILPFIAVAVALVTIWKLPDIIGAYIASPTSTKATVALLVVCPIGLILGFFFPIGMRMFGTFNQRVLAWYWALNGACGVLASALSVFVSIYFGIRVVFVLGAISYLLVGISMALAGTRQGGANG